MSWTIWHNPRCSKSRQTLKLLQDQGVEPSIRLYLQDAPNAAEISQVVERLGVEPRALMRRKETLYKELNLKNDTLTAAQLVDAMAEHPALIERPIVLNAEKAAVGRPPENILKLL